MLPNVKDEKHVVLTAVIQESVIGDTYLDGCGAQCAPVDGVDVAQLRVVADEDHVVLDRSQTDEVQGSQTRRVVDVQGGGLGVTPLYHSQVA